MGKQKIVFFLGNGFSQGFGFPSTQDLWNISLKANTDYYKNPLDEAKKVYPLAYFISKDIRDIELLLTIWKSYWEAYEIHVSDANHHSSGHGHFEDYVENICGWLHSFTLKGSTLDNFNAFKSWLNEILVEYQISFITTNYDLLLEKAISENSLKYHYLTSEGSNSIPIRKLHGSISWFSSSHGILRKNDNFKYKSFFKGKGNDSYVYDFTLDCLSFPRLDGMHMQWGSQLRSDKVVPIFTLIPPIIGKKYNELFKSITNLAKWDFRDCNYFIIIGYSFPEADPVIRNIISESINKYMPKDGHVLCINDDEKVCEKVKRLFGNRIEFTIKKWNMGHLKGLDRIYNN